ncbi:MAG TPA: response regulator transcription factor [Luteibacter sp.]|uniref:response regulator transcription factor n=1 Tax=Luteibacter sp. TaxID=1886636 RepID=UPI002BD04F26|nr:response regulator transcription factor [Luteibacter sp.]HVI56008.1 response regulator transcription factor [Luteibacter sp.]
MTRNLRVLVIDDHPIYRAGIVAMIDGTAGMSVVGEAADGRNAIDSFDALRPDVTVVDLELPDMDGVELIKAIRRKAPTSRIVVLTNVGGDGPARLALRAGVQGYLLKTSVATDLIGAIRSVHGGKHQIAAAVARQLADHPGEESLSDRELSVLRGVAAGLENKQIALRLGISAETVKEHVSHALGKLRANNRTHAVAIALDRGFLR